jgi:hypothetical protein
MNFTLPAMVKINGSFYTDEGRTPVEIQLDERAITNELASGKHVKYIKQKARKFSISWEKMPNQASQAIDGKNGRNELLALIMSVNTFTLILDDGVNTAQTYTCLLSDYTETPALRRPGHMRWNVKVSFEEVG